MQGTKIDRCPVCGAVATLHAVHVVARSGEQLPRATAPVYMCANCHQQLDRHALREFEFEVVVADLMAWSSTFADVRLQEIWKAADGGRVRPDITANDKSTGAAVVVECKGAQAIAGPRLREAIAQLGMYKGSAQPLRLVLALPARLTVEQKSMALQEGVEVWDLDEIVRQFGSLIDGVTHPVLRPLLLSVAALIAPGAALTPEARLLEELLNTKHGRGSWHTYQKLIGRILERLFCPPLSLPLLEKSDEDRVNRRDIVLPNYAETGFWSYVRQRYAADFVVVDAKNYTDLAGKTDALQVLNYLKPHGAGMLGFIVTRRGGDSACAATIREQWTVNGKLLVLLTDEHLVQMLRVREAGGPAEEVVRQCIEGFRLSL